MRHTLKLIAATVLVALTTTGARAQCPHQGLASFGPISAATFGYPAYYVDQNGFAAGTCLDPANLLCGLAPLPDPNAPIDIATGNFFDEHLYTFVTADVPMPGGGLGLVVLAITGTFGNAAGAVLPNDQVVFSRVRFRIDTPAAGTYTITHPFGVHTLTAAAPGRRSINFTDDCLLSNPPTCGPASPTGFNAFTTPLAPTAWISTFLQWDATPPAPPAGFLGDPAILHTITGSPCGSNVFRVEGPGLPPGGVETNLWSVLGKRAEICGNGFLDSNEQCDDGNTVDGDCCSSTCTFEAAASACTNPCQVGATCDGAGVCGGGAPTLIAGPCTDQNVCTFRDTCAAGQCAAGGPAPCPTGTVDADAVIAQSSPNSKFGTTKTLDIDGSPVRQALFRVSVSGLTGQPIQSAKLRLTVGSATAASSSSGGRIHIAPCTWNETTVTWNTRPQPTFNAATLATLGVVARNEIVTFDVTSAIPGNGTYCFAIDTTSADNVIYNSREAAAALRPQLVLTTGCASCTPPVCGDNLVNRPTEACDGADDTACPGRCRANCTCGPPPVCGDGIVNQVSEQCDGASAIACPGQCRADCTCPAPPVCGDNIVNQVTESVSRN